MKDRQQAFTLEELGRYAVIGKTVSDWLEQHKAKIDSEWERSMEHSITILEKLIGKQIQMENYPDCPIGWLMDLQRVITIAMPCHAIGIVKDYVQYEHNLTRLKMVLHMTQEEEQRLVETAKRAAETGLLIADVLEAMYKLAMNGYTVSQIVEHYSKFRYEVVKP